MDEQFFADTARTNSPTQPTVDSVYIYKTNEIWTLNGTIKFGDLRRFYPYYAGTISPRDTNYYNGTINFLYNGKKIKDSTTLKIITVFNPNINLTDSLFVYLDSVYFAIIPPNKFSTISSLTSESKQTDNSPLLSTISSLSSPQSISVLDSNTISTFFIPYNIVSRDSIYYIDQKKYFADFVISSSLYYGTGNHVIGTNYTYYLFFSKVNGLVTIKVFMNNWSYEFYNASGVTTRFQSQ